MGSPESPPAGERGRPEGRWKSATKTLIITQVFKILVAVGQVAALVGAILRSCG